MSERVMLASLKAMLEQVLANQAAQDAKLAEQAAKIDRLEAELASRDQAMADLKAATEALGVFAAVMPVLEGFSKDLHRLSSAVEDAAKAPRVSVDDLKASTDAATALTDELKALEPLLELKSLLEGEAKEFVEKLGSADEAVTNRLKAVEEQLKLLTDKSSDFQQFLRAVGSARAAALRMASTIEQFDPEAKQWVRRLIDESEEWKLVKDRYAHHLPLLEHFESELRRLRRLVEGRTAL